MPALSCISIALTLATKSITENAILSVHARIYTITSITRNNIYKLIIIIDSFVSKMIVHVSTGILQVSKVLNIHMYT